MVANLQELTLVAWKSTRANSVLSVLLNRLPIALQIRSVTAFVTIAAQTHACTNANLWEDTHATSVAIIQKSTYANGVLSVSLGRTGVADGDIVLVEP